MLAVWFEPASSVVVGTSSSRQAVILLLFIFFFCGHFSFDFSIFGESFSIFVFQQVFSFLPPPRVVNERGKKNECLVFVP